MTFSIKLALIIFAFAIVADLLWLGVFANNFYKNELGSLYTKKVNFVSAIFVYLIMSIGIAFFVVGHPSADNLKTGFYVGAFFGFTLYAVYDLTNLAVLKNYSIKMVVVDIVWGSLLGGLLGVVGKYFA
jgi:uncharacterized membrane protein